MTANFGAVVLVPFPFTDQSGVKKRPAMVVSSNLYHAGRRDLIILAITSQIRMPLMSPWVMASGQSRKVTTKPPSASSGVSVAG
jgi:mRNA interferase MazF